jgi:uncharacterized protein with FMN-binding domain
MKLLKILGYIVLGVVVFGLGLAGYATLGLKEVKNLPIQSVSIDTLDDGEYTGRYENGRWTNEVIVTISNHQIIAIESTHKTETDAQYDVLLQIIDTIIVEQTPDIDTVAGASATTKSFSKAVEMALQNEVD